MSNFVETIEGIRERFFTFEEFPFVKKSYFPKNGLRNVMLAGEGNLEIYAASLKGRDVEGLLRELVCSKHEEEIRQAARVLCLRRSKRIVRLTGILFQYHYNAEGIKFLVRELLACSGEDLIEKESFLRRFGSSEDPLKALADAIEGEGNDVDALFRKYGIVTDSALAMEACFDYFGRCVKIGCLLNTSVLLRLIEDSSKERLGKIINHYLSTLTLLEYSDNVNAAILSKIGDPYISPDWAPYDRQIREKFSRWSYLRRLKEHCQNQPEKFGVLVEYLNQVKTNYIIPKAEALIIDFGEMILADVKDRDTFLYEKSFFEREMELWEMEEGMLPIFVRGNADILTARMFMLSEDDAPCIRLSYGGIHRYYADEVLNIKTGLEPDMRAMRLRL